MQHSQNQTLGLIMLLLLVLVAGVFSSRVINWLQNAFTYQHVAIDLNPINPNFDWTQLQPKITIPTPHIDIPNPFKPSPQQSTQTPSGVAVTTDASGNPLPQPAVVPGAGGDPQTTDTGAGVG